MNSTNTSHQKRVSSSIASPLARMAVSKRMEFTSISNLSHFVAQIMMKTVHRLLAKGFCTINNYTHFSTSLLFPTPTKAFSHNLSDMQASEFISCKMVSSYFGRNCRTCSSKHAVQDLGFQFRCCCQQKDWFICLDYVHKSTNATQTQP